MEEKNYTVFEKIKNDTEVKAYIGQQNSAMKALHYTEHGFAHIALVAERARQIMTVLGQDEHITDITLAAAWLHDIGNIINRTDHSQSGALMAFQILHRMEVPADDIAQIICAIGNHDEGSGVPVSIASAALILADKSDVRRSRVQEKDHGKFDIHDRVNYSVTQSDLHINTENHAISLVLKLDTAYSEVGEFFEIFMDRMRLCQRAANYLGLKFHLVINEQQLM